VGDYAACIGTTGYDMVVSVVINDVKVDIPPTGVFTQTKGVTVAEISDGLSNTLLFGEKHVPLGNSLTYPYDCNLYDGHNIICSTRNAGPGYPIAQGPTDTRVVFGGPHVGICMFTFADGSVHPVRTSIDEYSLGLLAHRADGQPAPTDY
jgi:hypothetical protein